MKKLLLGLALLAAGTGSYAQSYYSIKKIGVADSYDWQYGLTNGNVLLNKPNNDVLSSSQTVPFSFTLFGNSYTSYKVSDNGYLTFDTSASTSDNTPATLPSASKPQNSIFGFWADLELKAAPAPNANFPVKVLNYSYGTSPNRVHVIQWFGVSKKGAAIAANSDVLAFAVRLYEDSHFDVVYSWGGNANFTGSVGTQDAGNNAYTISGSPSFSFPLTAGASQKNADAIIYTFKSGTQPDWDASVISSTIKNVVKLGNVNVAGVVTNYGKSTINTFDINYSVDGGATVTKNITGVNIAPGGGTYSFTHPTAWVPATPGKLYACKIWASNLNGNNDANPSDDEFNVSCFVNEGLNGTKHVLLEEGSGAWCGYCPDGHLIMTSILEDPNYAGKVFGVVHHNGDGMTNANSDIINSKFATGYPFGMIDRTLFSGQTSVGLSRNLWVQNVDAKLNAPTPVDVTITNKKYDPATRKLTFTVKANFADYYMGDLRLNAFIVEDKVRGADVHSTWTQHQYYSKQGSAAGGPSHPLYELPEWMVGYVHNHVVRKVNPIATSSAWGDAGIIPTIVSKGDTYTQNYSYTIPVLKTVTGILGKNTLPCNLCNENDGDGMNKPSDIKIIGFVSMYDATDITKYEVLNSMEESSVWGTGVTEKRVSTISVSSLYPNPTQDVINVELNLTQSANVAVTITDVAGKLVQTVANKSLPNGASMLPLSTLALQNGIYFMTLNVNGQSVTHRFVVAH